MEMKRVKVCQRFLKLVEWVGCGAVVFLAGIQFAVAQSYSVLDLTLPGGYESEAWGINNNGQITGRATTASGYYHAFLYSGGAMTDLGNLGGDTFSQAYGINSNGQVVGEAATASGVDHAFLYNGGAMVDLNTLISTNSGWILESAQAINDNGQIVGWGTNPSGQYDAFLLTPVPEPASMWLLALGSLVFLLRKRR